ncbi:FecCD family ABC transporter permease [Rossellomorea marisflavi]|uniref:Iron ABC transporter permease n=1 Tax=Rossellomorea marisflavi TaxID=189381 RepID=A0A0J5VBL9_9BACI|nr:iron ABC transporter permease [Rossellomorea marisflavi]KMK94649.1 iron ABC transporter permease [Rossellomorea marisflavi]KML07649.1 iron ABC transporter permease [Rossellomorea marisflavi]KZE48672.1 iron ABC transporter permease [Rossellomorea marisflavi]MCM2605357.1 iron ABC transporter permease [Rossellomorea marisflavi]QHA35638.1 iron chelate uptake ABC transporter family permease subunit [Rossellomorea marisflavi]
MIHPKLLKKQRAILIALLVFIVSTVLIGISLGYSSVSIDRLIPTIMGNGSFKDEFILFSIRLPRIVITVLAGMALALSGSILQTMTKNDLADPGIIGINSGAGVAITVFFLFFPIDAGSFAFMLPLVAFAGAILTAGLIYFFSSTRGSGLQPVKMILVGVGFSTAFSGLMIIMISSAERAKVDFIANWLAGNIWGADWPFVWAILPWLVVLIPFTLYKARTLNLLALSDSATIGVGVALKRERIILLFTAVALAASAVSVTGGIAFIGLMAPHLAKSLVGPRHQLYLPVALLLGGWLLLAADTVGRNVLEPDGLPAGIMAALIGAPYFVYLLLKK